MGRARRPSHDHMAAASGIPDYPPCAIEDEAESAVRLDQLSKGVLPKLPVGKRDADNTSPTVGQKQVWNSNFKF